MTDDTPEIEHSKMCGRVTEGAETVDVRIYRTADSGSAWTLEVVNLDGGSTVWDETFATDRDAYAEFYRTLKSEGIASFKRSPATRH